MMIVVRWSPVMRLVPVAIDKREEHMDSEAASAIGRAGRASAVRLMLLPLGGRAAMWTTLKLLSSWLK